jgi:hypothetical protein
MCHHISKAVYIRNTIIFYAVASQETVSSESLPSEPQTSHCLGECVEIHYVASKNEEAF